MPDQISNFAGPTKEAESRAGEAPRKVLEKVPILQVEGSDAEVMSGDWEPGLIARLLVDGRTQN